MNNMQGIHLENYMVNIYDERALIFWSAKDGYYIRLESTREKIVAPSYERACNILYRMGYHF